MVQTLVRYVFMSYSRSDEAIMRRITAFIRKQGVKIWVDNEKLTPGTPIWETEIEKAISGAAATIVILSPDSKESVWVRREISYAERYGKRIFPLLVRGDEDSSISLRLAVHQYIDFRKNEEAGLNSLFAAMAIYLEELETQARKEREEAEKIARAKAERELAEREAAYLKSEREAAEKAIRKSQEKAAREKIEQDRIEQEQSTVQEAKKELAVLEKEEVKPVEKEEINVPAITKAKEKFDQSDSNETTISPRWGTGVWITIGWTIALSAGSLIGGLAGALIGWIATLSDPLAHSDSFGSTLASLFLGALAGTIIGSGVGGYLTAIILRNEHVLFRWRTILIITIAWIIGGPVGLLVNGAIGGAIGGFGTAIALRMEQVISHWRSLLGIILGWTIGWAIFGWAFQPEKGDLIGLAIGGVIGIAMGGYIMIWQIREAKKLIKP